MNRNNNISAQYCTTDYQRMLNANKFASKTEYTIVSAILHIKEGRKETELMKDCKTAGMLNEDGSKTECIISQECVYHQL